MLWEPTGNEISCMLNATASRPGVSRAYPLTDGRVLNLHERGGGPGEADGRPDRHGHRRGERGDLVVVDAPDGPAAGPAAQGSLAGVPDIEFYIELSDQAADLRVC